MQFEGQSYICVPRYSTEQKAGSVFKTNDSGAQENLHIIQQEYLYFKFLRKLYYYSLQAWN